MASMLSLLRNLSGAKAAAKDLPSHPDTSETVHISSLALLKMLRHARSGVPMEVMGLMLGEFVDDYTINVVDVFAMPQSGTGVSVEAIDPVYEAKMLDILKSTGRTEMVVGWYHSHPGFGCWLSSVDVATQQSFEALSARAVAVVVDPVQSVRGKVVIDAFRSIPNMGLGGGGGKLAPTSEPRQTTSNLGHLVRPSMVAAVHGLGFRYYSLPIAYKLGAKEAKMLQCLGKQHWDKGLHTIAYPKHNKHNEQLAVEMHKMTKLFTKDIVSTANLNQKEIELRKMGRLNSKRRLEDLSREMLEDNIVQTLCAVSNTRTFR
uniref:MPN domain-containing protein n=1 Tax=Panagrellus redivivus TaxID=6233 RepID=A0A7E4VSH7_PANRE